MRNACSVYVICLFIAYRIIYGASCFQSVDSRRKSRPVTYSINLCSANGFNSLYDDAIRCNNQTQFGSRVCSLSCSRATFLRRTYLLQYTDCFKSWVSFRFLGKRFSQENVKYNIDCALWSHCQGQVLWFKIHIRTNTYIYLIAYFLLMSRCAMYDYWILSKSFRLVSQNNDNCCNF